MAFVVGPGQSAATRWANMLELQKCLLGPLTLPAGIIECGIDYTQCYYVMNGAYRLYKPIVAGATISTLSISGPDPGIDTSFVPGSDESGDPMPVKYLPPLTTLVIFVDTAANPGVYVDDYWIIQLQSETMRTRVTTISHLNIVCEATPSLVTFPGFTGDVSGRLSISNFLKETCTNDTQNMIDSPGNHTTFNNVHVLGPMTGWVGFAETSSGSYSEFNFIDCTVRGWVGGLAMFGAGPTIYQPLGKRINLWRTDFPAVYGQPPGPEVKGTGGNAIYIHPVFRIRARQCNFGSDGGIAIGEYVAERGIYLNGGTTGFAPDQLIWECVFWENCIQGVKCQSGRRADGTQGAVSIQGGRILSAWKALTQDDSDLHIQDVEFGAGECSATLPDVDKIGAGVLIERCTFDCSYATPPDEYRGGQVEGIVSGGHITYRNCEWTVSATIFPLNSSAGTQLIVEDSTVVAIGDRSTVAGFLNAARGLMQLRRVTVSGQIRPFYWQRPDVLAVNTPVVAEDCDFSGCTVGYRVLLDQVNGDYSYRTMVSGDTLLPSAAPTVTGPAIQSWVPFIAVAVAPVASSSTMVLSPQYNKVSITGAATINTINIQIAGANILFDGAVWALTVAPGGTWALGAAGNITPLSLLPRVAGHVVFLQYDATLAKFVEFRRNTMENRFVDLPVPAQNGVGAGVLLYQGTAFTTYVSGSFGSSVTIEVSNNDVDAQYQTLAQFTGPAVQTFDGVWKYARVRVAGYDGGGVPYVGIGATIDPANVNVFTMAVPAADGVGASSDFTLYTSPKRVSVSGAFTGVVTIEVSPNGTNFVAAKTFTNPGSDELEVVAAYLRVRRSGVRGGSAPVVTVGSVVNSAF